MGINDVAALYEGGPQAGPSIVEVSAYPYWLPQSLKPQLVVRVRTSDGITGWGEAGLTYRERAVSGAVEHLAALVVGRDAFAIGAIWQEMYRRHYFEGCRTISAAMAAIDVALHDIKGQALGVPVYELLGGKHRDRIDCYPTTAGKDAAAMVASALALRARGFNTLRLHLLPTATPDGVYEPRASIALTADAMRQVREAVGPRLLLGIDYHHRLSPAEAASFCALLPPGTLDFIEEPIRAQNVEAYRRLRQSTPIPFAIGEEFTSKWEFRTFLEAGLLGFARIDLANAGGFTEAMKIAGWCEAHYVDVMPHNPLGPINTAATLHFAAALPNLAPLEARAHQVHDPLGIDADLYPVQPLMEGPQFAVPRAPGLGLMVDEDALSEATAHYRSGHAERLARGDGSLTNA